MNTGQDKHLAESMGATPSDMDTAHAHYRMVSQAIAYVVDNQITQPTLADVAAAVGLGEHHVQRVFSQWVGVSPKQFLQFLTLEHAKQHLRDESVMGAALASGLSGSSRLHDLFIRYESMTPGEYKQGGAGLVIEYGVHPSPFGLCFLAVTTRGVCKLAFFDEPTQAGHVLAELKRDWPNAQWQEQPESTKILCDKIFHRKAEPYSRDSDEKVSIHLLLKGTPFRLQVWQALLALPAGCLTSYQQVADAMGKPKSVRAVASAIANNDIGFLIPCHRVIRSTGALSEYRWGKTRKSALIGWEQSRCLSGQ